MVVWGLARCGMFGFGLEVGRGWWWRDGLLYLHVLWHC